MWLKFYRINICWFHILSNKYLLMSYFIVLTLYLPNTELISIFLLNNELRTPPSRPSYLAFQLSSHPYLCTCQIRKQSDKKFLSLNPTYEKKYTFFHIWGVLGGPLITSNPGERKFQGSKTSSQSRHMYNKGTK